MRRKIKLFTSAGRKVSIFLEHWGAGLDRSQRRWTLGDGCWECVDTGELAEESRLGRVGVFNRPPSVPGPSEAPAADRPRARVAASAPMRGQTMVEYALIIAAVGAVAWGGYNFMGHDIGSMASGIDSSLTSS
jgi:hypothetical protein